MRFVEWFTDVDCECDCCRPRRARPGSAAFVPKEQKAAEVQGDNEEKGDDHADGTGGWD